MNHELEREYNKICGRILQNERKKRKITMEELASGILSRTAMGKMESGKMGWPKLTGDTLMHRMGLSAHYFEEMASSDELSRWRDREDICLLILDEPETAKRKLQEYKERHEKIEALEKQFLLKAETVLLLSDKKRNEEICNGEVCFGSENDQLLKLAEEAVSCTVRGSWKQEIGTLWLAPSELEAVLLAAAALAEQGEEGKAWELQQAVWNYPKTHQWKEEMEVLIAPQAALLGIKLSLHEGDSGRAIHLGKEAVELLRRRRRHYYLLPLLKLMETVAPSDQEEEDCLRKLSEFRHAFAQIYQQCNYPKNRIWQGIFVDNTRDSGIVLEMLRKYADKPRAQAVYDGTELVVTDRQLEKIEKGVHKPSCANYQRLIKQYGIYGGWTTAMVETDSAEVLALRQKISTLIEHQQWKEMEREVEVFRSKVNSSFPRVRQELLLFEALIEWKKDGDSEKCLQKLLDSLRCTVPFTDTERLKWWVFQREEIIIASDIASFYRRTNQLEEAERRFKALLFSLEQQCRKTGIPHVGYEVVMDGYDNLLGDMGRFREAVKHNERAAEAYIKCGRIDCLASAFYRIAWNAYELAAKKGEEDIPLHDKWRNCFRISKVLADFTYHSHLKEFLQKREEKYLC